jgi:hypothetical protein
MGRREAARSGVAGQWPQSRSCLAALTSGAAGRCDVSCGQTTDSHQSMDWWVITFAICLVMPIPVVPVRPIVAMQMPVVPVSVTVAATGSTASHRCSPPVAGLRYCEGNSWQSRHCTNFSAEGPGTSVPPITVTEKIGAIDRFLGRSILGCSACPCPSRKPHTKLQLSYSTVPSNLATRRLIRCF